MLNMFIKVCPPGTFLNSHDMCEDCPMGEWNDLFNQTSCKNCIGGRTYKNIRADECSEYIALSHSSFQKISENLRILFHSFSPYLISACVQGEFLSGDECKICGEGTYQDSPFHSDTICKNCSGTETNFVMSL